MAVTVGSIAVLPSTEALAKLLDTITVATTEGTVHREGVFIADPEVAGNRALVSTAGTLSITVGSGGSTANAVGSVALLAGSSANTLGSVALIAGTTANSLGSVALLAGSSATMVGAFTVNNPTTQVTISNPTTAVTISNPSTTVDANLTSAGSTRTIGVVGLNAGSSANVIGSVTLAAGTSANILGSFTLAAGTSANVIGSVTNAAATTGTMIGTVTLSSAGLTGLTSGTQTIGTVINTSSTSQIGSVSLLAGSSANVIGSVTLAAGTSANTIGSVVNAAGSSAVVIGQVSISTGNEQYLGLGTSATYQFMQSIPFSSGNTARTSISTTVDIQIIAANANRKALVVASRSTAQTVGIGYSTAILTTALANVDLFLAPSSVLSFGLQGGLPLYRGPLRGINLTSTTVAGSVSVIEFT